MKDILQELEERRETARKGGRGPQLKEISR